MRGDQLARQWRILQHIESSRHGLTVAEIAREEGISLRTAYRDLEALQGAGFPLSHDRIENANRWAFVDTYKFKIPHPFTLTELMSLHFYSDLAKVFKGTIIHDSLESLFRKVKSTLPPQTLAYLSRIQSSFSVGIKPYKEYGKFKEFLNQANRAILENRCIEMAYLSLRSKTETTRKIDPYKIWFFEGPIYLIGWCHLRREIRMFVLDRIRMLRLTDDRFSLPPDFDVDAFMQNSFKVMHGNLYSVRIRISPKWSRWVKEKIWHESQTITLMADGGIEIAFQVAGLEEVKQWVLSLGPEALVVEPEALRLKIEGDLRRTLEQYAPSRNRSTIKLDNRP